MQVCAEPLASECDARASAMPEKHAPFQRQETRLVTKGLATCFSPVGSAWESAVLDYPPDTVQAAVQ